MFYYVRKLHPELVDLINLLAIIIWHVGIQSLPQEILDELVIIRKSSNLDLLVKI